MTPTRFRAGAVDVGGVHVSYLEAGQGMPLVHLQAAAASRPTPAHVLLAHRFRVLISYGDQWFAWYMRRLAERPANVLFALRAMFS